MAATVKAIDARSIHQIQSGQVIVDLCSVVKELVENSLDAGATIVEVRFKNNGLDEIEIQDNGSGISSANYESVALKHYTSKLSSYEDLDGLSTFGFRGEALSSLCALSKFTITTAQAHEAPKGQKLTFEVSGKLKNTTIVACQKGTVATVGNLFENLPVRRKELSKNIKREYAKVLGLLHAYACISINVKFTVKNAVTKGKGMVVFATQGNGATRENIANVYGAKTLSALVPLELELAFDSELSSLKVGSENANKVAVKGHISKPVFGEGRQTPDRQMFFVNGRPCGLPQIAKAVNEVYKSFNVSQSPFVFADFQMDTSAYDVNVSPDKRSIFLHNAASMIEALKFELTSLFEDQEQTVPQSTFQSHRRPTYKQLAIPHTDPIESSGVSLSANLTSADPDSDDELEDIMTPSKSCAIRHETSLQALTDNRGDMAKSKIYAQEIAAAAWHQEDAATAYRLQNAAKQPESQSLSDTRDDARETSSQGSLFGDDRGEEEQMLETEGNTIPALGPVVSNGEKGIVTSAFDRMRPRRLPPEIATITIGGKTVTRTIVTAASRHRSAAQSTDGLTPQSQFPSKSRQGSILQKFANRLGQYSAIGTEDSSTAADGQDSEHEDTDDELHDDEDGRDDNDPHIPSLLLSGRGQHDASDNDDSLSSNDGIVVDVNAADPDSEPMDEAERKAMEERRVAELIRGAEGMVSTSKKQGHRRATQSLKGGRGKDATFNLEVWMENTVASISEQTAFLQRSSEERFAQFASSGLTRRYVEDMNVEEKLSLTVAKPDFEQMQIVGQFNLGFILAVRASGRSRGSSSKSNTNLRDELFIIDQHASDEKYNFERLQAETVVGNQRMVKPVTLDLTAVEEEVLIESFEALEKNGFLVDVDISGEKQVGSRCQLVGLPISREVVFDTRDLDELIHLLRESPMLSDARSIPRPTKVRKMFAMRACRSSIMIGKTLSKRQMSNILQHMGRIDKPWNCPHGRPTMRHLASLDAFDKALWQEGDGADCEMDSGELDDVAVKASPAEIWKNYGSA